MNRRIPPYLIALAVGELRFRAVSNRTGVWAEPNMLRAATSEFGDMESMVRAAEELYGPYQWDRYDVLVLPPSFPFGGMENPRLTFATPTILAGDKSLISLVAHELAHSWSGNLVTNATWADFWLNEGFTVYIERRILEKVYGKAFAEREAVLGRDELIRESALMPDRAKLLKIDLKGQDPDDNVTAIPYEKGALFLTHLENTVGRKRFDTFLKSYFAAHAFRSITTEEFVAYLRQELLKPGTPEGDGFPVDEWITKPTLPKSAPRPDSSSLRAVESIATTWLADPTSVDKIPFDAWSTQERLFFLRSLEGKVDARGMRLLDEAFKLTQSTNSEIVFQWLLLSIQRNYRGADERIEKFLTTVGRRKFVRPLYDELCKTPVGRVRAKAIYAKARSSYHPITQGSVDAIVNK
jgi:aminopeptidase N